MESKTMTKIGALRCSMPLAHVQSPTFAAKPWTGRGTGVDRTPIFFGTSRVPLFERSSLR